MRRFVRQRERQLKKQGVHPAAAPSAKGNNEKQGGDHMLYQPALRTDQIEALHHLKVALRRPMTKLAQEAVDRYLQEMKRKEEQACRAGPGLARLRGRDGERGQRRRQAKR